MHIDIHQSGRELHKKHDNREFPSGNDRIVGAENSAVEHSVPYGPAVDIGKKMAGAGPLQIRSAHQSVDLDLLSLPGEGLQLGHDARSQHLTGALQPVFHLREVVQLPVLMDDPEMDLGIGQGKAKDLVADVGELVVNRAQKLAPGRNIVKEIADRDGGSRRAAGFPNDFSGSRLQGG